MQYAAEKSRTGHPALLIDSHIHLHRRGGALFAAAAAWPVARSRPASISVALFAAAAAQRVLAAVIAFVAANAAAPVPAVAAAATQTAAAAVIQTAIDAIAAALAAITVSLPAAGFLIAADLLLAAAFFAAADAIGTRTALLCGRRGVPAAVLPALRLPAAAPVFAEQDTIQ